MQRRGGDPPVAAIVARAGRDHDARGDVVGEAAHDLGRGGGAGALHEGTRGNARRDGRAVGSLCARRVDDEHARYFSDAPTVRP